MTTNSEESWPLTDAVVPLSHEDRSAFTLIARAHLAIQRSDRRELAAKFLHEATLGDYAHLLASCRRYVTVQEDLDTPSESR
jgi:hypothetical protein